MEDRVRQQARETAPGVSVPHESAALHVAGEATYVDDIPEFAGTLYLGLGLSEQAHARIKSIDYAAVKAAPGYFKGRRYQFLNFVKTTISRQKEA